MGKPTLRDKQGVEVLLADIGNTFFHVYDGTNVEHLLYEDTLAKYQDKVLYYIPSKSEIVSFKKTNGKKSEYGGAEYYTMYYESEVSYPEGLSGR